MPRKRKARRVDVPTIISRARVSGRVCSGTLQDNIDAASPGSTVNVTGCTFSAGATVNKALTLVGGTLNVPINQKGLTITANNVTIDGMTITGAQRSTYDLDEAGIYVNATSGARRTGLVIKNCTISNFGGIAVYLIYTSGALIGTAGNGNTISACGYAGIWLQSDLNSIVTGNTVSDMDPGDLNHNQYGIVTTSLGVGEDNSVGTIIQDNIVTDCIDWHGLDTHGGIDHQWLRNHVSRCSRGLFLTDGDNGAATDNIVDDNIFDEGTVRWDAGNPYGVYIAAGVTGTLGDGNFFDGYIGGNYLVNSGGGTNVFTNNTVT